MTQTLQDASIGNIAPHGGRLVDLVAEEAARNEWSARANELPQHVLTQRECCDLELMAVGGLSPLGGFMTEEDYRGTVESMRLADGTVWPLPVTLAVGQTDAVSEGSDLALYNESGALLGILHVASRFTRDKTAEAKEVFRTEDEAHPGVDYLMQQSDVLLGGPVTVLALPKHDDFVALRQTPAELRALFASRGWKTIAGFQTRNPIHRAHEYLTKCALEITDGLLLHPLVGETKSDDVPADIRMRCYEVILDRYYPKDRTVLSVLEASMRYAGPREAIFHAIMRKNYGCTHFIVGRDHAGVGNYYGTYDAQKIFDEFTAEEIGIIPLKFEHSFFCKRTGQMATSKTSPSSPEERVFLSGTKVRQMLEAGERPPAEFSRPEVADVLIEGYRAMAAK
jgi:sulfate adenylyltransferase